jgi:hypothetical protein
LFHKFKVFFRAFLNGLCVFVGHLANHSAWDAHDQRTRGDDLSLTHEGSSSDDTLFTNHGSRQDDGVDAHECPVADGAGVQASLVADYAVVAHDTRLVIVGVHDASVLDAGSFSNMDLCDVGPQDGTWPNAGLFPHGDGPHENRRVVNAASRSDLGASAFVIFKQGRILTFEMMTLNIFPANVPKYRRDFEKITCNARVPQSP